MHWRTQDLLTRHGPKVLLVASLGLVTLLAVAGPAGTVPGYAEVAPVRVASLESGRVTGVMVTPGDLVEKGAIVGLLDETPLRGRMRVLEAELSRSGALLAGQERDAQTALAVAEANRAESAARLAAAREGLRIAEQRLTDRRVQVTAGLATRDSLVPLETEVATLRGEVRQFSARLGAQTEVAEMAASGMDADDDGPAPAVASEARALGVIEEELALLEERRKDLTLRAPLGARVSAVNYRVGEVLPEELVFVELLPLETTTVVACVPEQYGVRIEAGGAAELWPADGGAVREGTVVDVSGLVSEAPDRCKQRPNEVGWVRPVRLEVEGAGLVPGQRFDVSFVPPGESS
ncbi:MAG: hypothetical protein GY898_26815 [Proteobacteria bacterium]|nr:hypothetical protein [Pseudomonadota bacterium]